MQYKGGALFGAPTYMRTTENLIKSRKFKGDRFI